MSVSPDHSVPTTAKTPYLSGFVEGIPYGQDKPKGDTAAPGRWSAAVTLHTADWPKVHEACAMNVTFLLPIDKFPGGIPYGNDLDNMLKRLFDALKKTIFSEAPGGDSCVVVLHAMKTPVPAGKMAGVALEILPVSV